MFTLKHSRRCKERLSLAKPHIRPFSEIRRANLLRELFTFLQVLIVVYEVVPLLRPCTVVDAIILPGLGRGVEADGAGEGFGREGVD